MTKPLKRKKQFEMFKRAKHFENIQGVLILENDISESLQGNKFIGADVLANMLGLCEATIYNWVKQKKLPAYKFGNQYKLYINDVFDFIASCKVA